ncbi:hypothetical protein BIW11_04588 [Tropilaelaps mercedesae]|uniref:tRNA (guanosine(18)-2'-O)-methyltransferase TARBP1 n=1 Tax=Tropilaelaps mercedesae TaxID=418985 RepID=A0A1V9X4F6_9ACAR|nr:hypothetical protein BIW11_04588 [Tropilaelaps mercedesae]
MFVDLVSVNTSQVDWILSYDEIAARLDSALQETMLHNSKDTWLRRSSLTLLGLVLCKRKIACAELIVNMLSVAEQKQIHIIEPVLTQFVEATRASAITEIFWTLRVFGKLFHHQTSWVRTKSLQQFLSLREFHRRVFSVGGENFYTNDLLDAIDQLSLYARTENCPITGPSLIGSAIREWLQALQEEISEDVFARFIADLIGKVCARTTWCSVALLYVSESLVSLDGLPVIGNLQPIQRVLSIWSFQEPLVRKYITRLWLEIACKFTGRRAKYEGLCNLASQFIEEAVYIKDHLTSLETAALSPANLCVVAWTHDPRKEEILNQNACNPHLWVTLSKIRAVPCVWLVFKDAIALDSVQRSGLALIKSSEVSDSEKNDIVSILSDCNINRGVLDEAIGEHIDWRLIYLWSKVADPSDNSPIITKCLAQVTEISDWAEMFAQPSIVYIFRTLANISKLDCFRSHAARMFEIACSLLPLTPRPMVPDLLRLIKTYLGAATEREKIARMLKMAWISCLETRKATTVFSECVDVFMTILFNETVFVTAYDDVLELCTMIREYVDSVPWFGEMFYLAMVTFLKANPLFIAPMCDKLALGLCYGPVFRKDQKVILDTERYVLRILTSNMTDSASLRLLTECESSINVRAKCVSFARSIKPNDAWTLIRALHAHDSAVSSTRRRYFNNSNIHRVKTRVWQSILVLLGSSGDFPRPDSFLQDIFHQLESDTHQMTVRILMEWCAVKVIINRKLDVAELVSSAIDKASSNRIGSICSYLNILNHVCCAAWPGTRCQIVARCVPLVMPWMMAQHFAVRRHAQFIFRRILSLCRCEPPRCHAMYQPQLDALEKVVNYGGSAKNAARLDNDFYLAESVLPECETYDLVFDKIPKAYGLTDVDCIPRRLFEDDSTWMKNSEREVNTELRIEMVDENSLRPDAVATVQETNYQRKIVPVSALLEEDRRLSSPANGSAQGQLIVVASLVDRLPNLGGICRTAEIFAVSELAIANIKILETKEFHNLSVSSHNWLPIRGVPPSAIEEYLREKKLKGFTLIGVEQTERSTPLNEFTFPKKSLLLLGNEKEGLPLHLIHKVDHCVEIPQQGVIRSLNVHVSAALLVWEFRKQHLPARASS